MGTKNKAVYPLDQAEVLQEPDCPPECRPTATGSVSNSRGFYVNIPVIRPKPEEPESSLSLRRRQAEPVLETIADLIKALQEELRGDNPAIA